MGSLPARGVWIEIDPVCRAILRTLSLPARGVWIEILKNLAFQEKSKSLPARGVWIEIIPNHSGVYVKTVTPREGGVD